MATIETNWDEIPAEYRFTAVNECGNKWAYLYKPELSDCVWCCVKPEDCTFIGYVDGDCENWRESLRERPPVVSAVPTGASYYDVTVTNASNMFMQHNMIFHNEDGDVGKLEWTNGILEFSGNATESAKEFMYQLATQFHTAIEIEIERRVKELQSNGESDD